MNRRMVVAGRACVVLLLAGLGALLLRNQSPAPSWVEHRGTILIIHGRGPDAQLGYLPAGGYELTIDENRDGCADSLSLFGDDGVEWFRLDPHLINYKAFARTRQIPGQRYVMHVDSLDVGGLGPRSTPSPISDCVWTFELAPA